MEEQSCSAFLSQEELEWLEHNGCWDCSDCVVPYRKTISLGSNATTNQSAAK